MRRFLVPIVAVAVLAAPAVALAATFSSGEEVSLGVSQRVAGDLYVAAGTATIGGTINGDLIATGGTLSVTGEVTGDVTAAGGTVQLLGPVSGSVRAAGGTVTVGGEVLGDVVAAGGTVRILSDARIAGGVYAAGGTVIIDGFVSGDARVRAGTLTLNGTVGGTLTATVRESLEVGSGGTVGGDLVYSAPSEADIATDASIAGAVEYSARGAGRAGRGLDGGAKAAAWAIAAALTALETFAMLGAAALMVWRWRKQASELLQEASVPIWKNAGWGVVYLIVTPIVALFLAAIIIGIIPSVLLITLMGALALISRVLAGVFLGALLERALRKRSVIHVTTGNALGGILLFQLIAVVPFAGWLVRALLFLAVFGTLAQRARRALV